MTASATTLRSFLDTLPIAEFEREREEILAAHFSERERATLAARAVRSAAGDYALKRALARLAAFLGVSGVERDFEIGRDESGAPVLLGMPTGFPAASGRVRFSIAHSRHTACGLAVLREGRDA
jgi:phosphopantetheinyl transferase (holo-ACP synthase)